MTDQLISFKTAVLAKEKGFDEELNIFITDKNHYEYMEGAFFKNSYDYITAPTQSLLQKWLREEHHSLVLIDKFLTKFICKVDNHIISHNKTGDILKFDTYEDALEQGLIESLKLINE